MNASTSTTDFFKSLYKAITSADARRAKAAAALNDPSFHRCLSKGYRASALIHLANKHR